MIYNFEPFELDTDRRRFTYHNIPISLSGSSLNLLRKVLQDGPIHEVDLCKHLYPDENLPHETLAKRLNNTWYNLNRKAKSEGYDKLLITTKAHFYSLAEDLSFRPTTACGESKPVGPFCVAVDTSLLVSADSYLGCFSVRDSKALSIFQFAVSIFCGCERLYLRKPPKRPDGLTPLLWLFWEYAAGEQRKTDETLLLEESQAPTLIEPFEVLLKDPDLPTWIDLHLSDPRVDRIYWSSGNPQEGLNISHRALKEAGILARSNTYASNLVRGDRMKLIGGARRSSGRFGGPLNYALTYAFSSLARGPVYAFAIDEAHVYEPSWVRRVALRHPVDVSQQYTDLINWGWIMSRLRGLIYPDPISGKEEEKKFRDCLFRLRRFTLDEKVNVRDLLGKTPKVHRMLYDGLRESGFLTSRTAIDALDTQDLKGNIILTPRASRAVGSGIFAGSRYWRSTVLDIVETIASGKHPSIL